MKSWRLPIVVLLLSVFLAGCFSSSTGRIDDERVDLISDKDFLDPRGPAKQQVTIKVSSRRHATLSLDDLLIQGATDDGRLIDVTAVEVEEQPVGYTSSAGDVRNELTLTINVEELVQQGITHIQIALKSDPLRFVIIALDPDDSSDPSDPGNPDEPSAPGDPSEPDEPGDPGEPDEPGQPGGPDQPGQPGGPNGPGNPPPPSQTTEIRTLRAGTSQATEAYIIRSSNPGPTVFIVGGVHGSETAGWMAAGEIKDWKIDAGILVVVPEANRPAVQRDRRTGPDGIDLNRQFPTGRTPTTALAREIWDLVLEFQPVALMDLHEGWGIRRSGDRFPGGTLSVGQTIITYNAGDARTFASHVIRYMDSYHVRTVAQPTYSFMLIGPPVAGSLARKAGEDLGIPAFIVEPTQKQTYLATRIRWHKVWVEELLRWYGLIDSQRVIVPKEYNVGTLPLLMPYGLETIGA